MTDDDLTEFNPDDQHWTIDGYTERVTRGELRYLLLERPDPIVAGKIRTWEHEKVGPNVYEIWIGDEQ